jgi:hypothetical protein
MMLRVVVRVAAPLLALVLTLATAGCESGSSSATMAPGSPASGDDRRTPVTVTTTPPGASVVVDGAVVGEAPITVRLNPGPHRLRATMSGYYPAPETRILVERGTATTHALSLVASH